MPFTARAVPVALLFAIACSHAARPAAALAPVDRPVAGDSSGLECLDSAIAPLIAQSRQLLPDFLRRVSAGLPSGGRPTVTTRLVDAGGRTEQVFVTVDSVRGELFYGRVASPVIFVRGYRVWQPVQISTDRVLDWTISRPDGTEEGNRIGKYLDQLQARLKGEPLRKPC